jgi:hypothetical protein
MGNPIQKMRASTALTLEAMVIAVGGCGTPESGSTIKFLNCRHTFVPVFRDESTKYAETWRAANRRGTKAGQPLNFPVAPFDEASVFVGLRRDKSAWRANNK